MVLWKWGEDILGKYTPVLFLIGKEYTSKFCREPQKNSYDTKKGISNSYLIRQSLYRCRVL